MSVSGEYDKNRQIQSLAPEQKSGRQETLNFQTEGLPFSRVNTMLFYYTYIL